MLMGHPPQISARGRENRPQGCFEGLTPAQVPMVVQELVTCDSEVQEALADALELYFPLNEVLIGSGYPLGARKIGGLLSISQTLRAPGIALQVSQISSWVA